MNKIKRIAAASLGVFWMCATVMADDVQDDMQDMDMSMNGMYGPYPMTREASGTSWQPDDTPMAGVDRMYGTWSVMWHGSVAAIHDHQGGPRGDEKTFTTSMFGVMAQRPLAAGTLGLRGMLSLDPTMGRSGYPLLFQTGETADGRSPLIDRQHPHDFFMELAASYNHPLSNESSVFGYAGLPGEPALGPPAYMHRFSALDNPEAPLTHHLFDATHVTFGVVTAGAVWRDWKLEGSAFNGREPDEDRWNIEARGLDSTSVRLSWNPTPAWAVQISRGWLDSPEALEPGISIRRTTTSTSYQHDFGGSQSQTTLAWARNDKQPGASTDGWLLESELQFNGAYTVFGRLERVEKDELFDESGPLNGRTFTVSKLSIGAIYDFAHIENIAVGIGGLVSFFAVPSPLEGIYDSDPTSYMLFVRSRLID